MLIPSRRKVLVLFIAAGVLATGGGPAIAQDEPPAEAPPLSIEEVIVEPGKPKADTLCRLRVQLKNDDEERIASQFAFAVEINGQQLPVYSNQLFMFPLQPAGTSELALYNFWSNETSRPVPADGKLVLKVTLREAQWMEIKDEDGVETWTPKGEVPGLPVSKSLTIQMDR